MSPRKLIAALLPVLCSLSTWQRQTGVFVTVLCFCHVS